MRHAFDPAGSRTKSSGGPPSSPHVLLGDAAPIGVRRAGLTTALEPTRPRNRRERRARMKRLRELAGRNDRKV
jgi:hypothetical protein